MDEFLAWTEGTSPDVFRLWCGIACVAGALERRCWSETVRGALFPNMYVMLVAPPGVGKDQAIDKVEELWAQTKGLHLSPDSVTSASMLDSFMESKRIIVGQDGRVLTEYHALLIAASEFIVFCPAYELEFLGRLTKIYDCKPTLRVKRKYIKEEVNIMRPYLTMLTGAQPGMLKTLFPEEAWSGGFTSRLIMVYSSEEIVPDIFAEAPTRADNHKQLLAHLARLTKLFGKFHWDTDAAIRMRDWFRSGAEPKPKHSRLIHYNTRRIVHTLKLSMISSASRGTDLRVMLPDFERARSWLLLAEATMPDIFRAMLGRSDIDVIRELHYYLWGEWIKGKKKGLPRSMLINFLASRVPHDKVMRVIEIACLGQYIKSLGEGLFEPIAQANQIGME